MIVWILLALFILFMYWREWIKDRANIITICFCVFLMFLTVLSTSRIYTTKFESESVPMISCRVDAKSDIYHFNVKGSEFNLSKNSVTFYPAQNKEDEIVELKYEVRHYRSMAPDSLYYLYYLSRPQDEKTVIYHSANIARVIK